MEQLKLIRINSTGSLVKNWQYFLIGNGFYDGVVDGDFGPKTLQATIEFQKKYGLEPDWEKAGLLHLVLSWGGSFVPRFVRGSRKTLSNHAFGSAFDINVPWNARGAVPALVGQKGSVRELVEIANNNGFYWGGHFSLTDGMHFEIARLIHVNP